MSALIVLIMGAAAAFNLLIILWKFQNGRTEDGGIDLALFALVMWLFSGSVAALSMGTIASAIISIYLLINPPNLDFLEEEDS